MNRLLKNASLFRPDLPLRRPAKEVPIMEPGKICRALVSRRESTTGNAARYPARSSAQRDNVRQRLHRAEQRAQFRQGRRCSGRPTPRQELPPGVWSFWRLPMEQYRFPCNNCVLNLKRAYRVNCMGFPNRFGTVSRTLTPASSAEWMVAKLSVSSAGP